MSTIDENTPFAMDLRKRFGKKVLHDYFAGFGRINVNKQIRSREELCAFLIGQARWHEKELDEGGYAASRFRDWSIDDIVLYMEKHFAFWPLFDLGMAASWLDGDFGHFRLAVLDKLRLHYATVPDLELRHGGSFAGSSSHSVPP